MAKVTTGTNQYKTKYNTSDDITAPLLLVLGIVAFVNLPTIVSYLERIY